jgi:hypothetical protein
MEIGVVGGKSFGDCGAGQNVIRTKKDRRGEPGGDSLMVQGKGGRGLKGVVGAQGMDCDKQHGPVEERRVRRDRLKMRSQLMAKN